VQALVDGVAALREGEDPDIGVLDGEQLQNAFAEDGVAVQVQLAAGGPDLGGRRSIKKNIRGSLPG